MAFTDWESHADLLEKLGEDRAEWDSATTFAEFDAAIRANTDLAVDADAADSEDDADGASEYDDLVNRLREHFSGDEELFEQIKLAALAQPATDLGLGEEWQGYFVSERADGEEVYSADRFALPSAWAKVEVSTAALTLSYDEEQGLLYDEEHWYLKDGKTVVTQDPSSLREFRDSAGNLYIHGELQAASAADLRQAHFDPDTGRWRRWAEDGSGFEYYHQEDGVWERLRDVPGTSPSHPAGPGASATAAEGEGLSAESQDVLDELAKKAMAIKPDGMSEEDAMNVLARAVQQQLSAASRR